MKFIKFLFHIAVILFLQYTSSFSQDMTDAYKRADSLAVMASDKVFYSDIKPVWIGNTEIFFYENRTPAGTEYIVINASAKTRRPAFDQKKFASAFGSVTGRKFDPDNLPVKSIIFSDRLRSFAFIWDDYNWICNLKDYRIEKRDKISSRESSALINWSFRDEQSNGPVTSPDKKWMAYIRDFNVWIRSNTDEKEYQLSYDGGKGEYYSSFIKWSPDSRKIVSCRVKPAEKHLIYYIESSPDDQLQPNYYSLEYPKPGDAVPQLYPQLFDTETKRHIKIDDLQLLNQYAVNNISWSKDSRYFTFEYNKRGHQTYQVIKVEPGNGTAKVIIDETSSTFIDYSGKRYRYDLEETEEIIWASERDGWNHLYLYDSGTGDLKNQITVGEWLVKDVVFVDPEKRQLVFKAMGREPGDPYFVHYYRINFDGTGLLRLTDGYGTHEASFSPGRRFFVDTWSRVDLPPVSVLRNYEDGNQIMVIERADASKLTETGIRFPELFVAKGRDGVTDIHGIIIRPLAFDPSKKYPVIENIYAGPHDSFVPKSFRPFYGEMQQLAELGFIVVQIDGMGTSNRSKAFHDVCWKNLKDAGFPDRILWIKAAAEKYPYMDIERVGIYGGSAGGQNAAVALLFHSAFYKVAVASCGCHDNRMDKIWWNEQWMGWPVGEEYAASSNTENAWRLKGKLLLINGELDDNVDPASTEQFVNALIKAGKEFEYVLVPGARHISNGGPYGTRKRRDFFVRNLLGINPPDWNIMEK
ncbi:MAG: DPP IV N-terminal domain-containing protein [Bacteroidales bacterium]|nr:DPP IV N-terminal domain-containing protein [Bacteroidales bacterium]